MELLNPLSQTGFPARSVAYTGTAGSTTTWPAGPQGVVVWSDQPCYIEIGDGVTATISAVMINAAGGNRVLTIGGTGLSVVNASNTFTGGVVLNSGIFAPGSVDSLGSGFTNLTATAGTITFSGGAVRLYANTNAAADALYARFKTPVSNSYKIDVPSGYSVAFTSPFVGTSGVGFEKLGDGTLTFNNTETYTGATVVSGGVLILGGSSKLASTGSLSVSTCGSYSCYPSSLGVTAEFRMGAYSQTIGAVTVGNGSVTSTTGILTSTSGFTLSPSTGGTATVSAILAGSVNLTQSGGGTGILSGVNTYTGITTISGGILQISQDANLGAAPGTVVANEITFNGGTLQITSSFTLNSNRGITLTGAGNILVDSGQTLTYAGIITGSGNLTKLGAGTLALSGTNTYTGITDISAGTIAISNAAALGGFAAGQGTTVQTGAALSISNNITVQEPISTSGTGVAAGGAIVFASGGNTYSGAITLAADSSIVSLSGAQTMCLIWKKR
jgi:autotransporter-associated beta strand protein